MSVDAGMAELAGRIRAMQDEMSGQPGVHVEVGAGLDVRLGRLVSLLEAEQRRRAALSQMLNVIDLPPLDFQVVGAKPKLKGYRAAATDLSPQEGLMWFVQRLTLAGLNSADVVTLHRTVSSSNFAPMTAVHQYICPAGIGAGLGVVDWEPGSNGLILRPDDGLWLDSGGTLTATELILTGQAIQVDLRILADYLM